MGLGDKLDPQTFASVLASATKLSHYRLHDQLSIRNEDTLKTLVELSYADWYTFMSKPDVYTKVLPYITHSEQPADSELITNINRSYRPSVDVNTALINYFQDDDLFETTVKSRILECLKTYSTYVEKFSETDAVITDGFWVFHGTDQEFDVNDKKETVTIAFLSTTLDLDIAIGYSGVEKHVYAIYVPADHPFINLKVWDFYSNDLCEILLPVGTKINETKKYSYINIMNSKEDDPVYINLHICMLDKIGRERIRQDLTDLHNSIENYTENANRCALSDMPQPPKLQSLDLNGSSLFFKQDQSLYKTVYKKDGPIPLLSQYQQLCRCINEMMAADIYRMAFGVKTLKYKLVLGDVPKNEVFDTKPIPLKFQDTIPTYFLKSDYIDNIAELGENELDEIFQTYIVDCIMSNWDFYNNGNICKVDGVLTHIDVGGAMMFRGRGDIKKSWVNSSDNTINDHITFLKEQRELHDFLMAIINQANPNISNQSNIKKIIYDTIYKHEWDKKTFSRKVECIKKKYLSLIDTLDYCCKYTEKLKTLIKTNCSVLLKRHEFYVNQVDIIIDPIVNLYTIHSGPPAGGKVSKSSVIVNKKVYTVKVDQRTKDRYIVFARKKTLLKAIKGKYRYVKPQAGGQPSKKTYEEARKSLYLAMNRQPRVCENDKEQVTGVTVTPAKYDEFMKRIRSYGRPQVKNKNSPLTAAAGGSR